MSATINQPYIFLAMIYGGLAIGLIYGGFSALKAALRSKAAGYILDSLFFLICGAACIYIIYISSSGNIRSYTFLGLLAGYLLYQMGIGRMVKILLTKRRTK